MIQSALNTLLVLTTGDLTFESIHNLKIACRLYFVHHNMLEDEQVMKIAWGVQDPRIQNWYNANQARINALEFDKYIEELKTMWLPADWEASISARVWSLQQRDQIFWEWVVEVQGTNTLLLGTPSFLTPHQDSTLQ